MLRRHVDAGVLLRRALLYRRLIVVELLVAGERDVGRRLEELFPELVVRLVLRAAHKRLFRTLDASHTAREWSPYCSTSGRMLDVTIRWALLKFWSISVGACQPSAAVVVTG